MYSTVLKSTGALLIGALLGASSSFAMVIGGTNYVTTGPTESLTASFLVPNGGSTTSQYYGYVQVSVGGTGFSLYSYINDAFYVNGPTHDSNHYQLTFGTTALVGNNPGQNAKHRIVYDLNAGMEVSPTYVPGYESSHRYNFVLNSGLIAAGTLYFGVGDGNFSDNGGAYDISVTQLTAATGIPDASATCGLLLGCWTGLVVLRRRWRS